MFAAVAAAGLISIPWLVLTRRTVEEWSLIMHSVEGRVFYAPALLYLALAGMALWRKRESVSIRWWAAVLIGVFLLCNAQMITGVEIESYHYRWIGNFAAVLLLCCWLGPLLPDGERLARCGLVAVCLIATGRAVSYAAQKSIRQYPVPVLDLLTYVRTT